MKKSLILIIFFVSLFSFQFAFGAASTTDDEMIVHQLVDNSCNENDLCEASLNETIYTCPHDCHQGNIDPAIIQAGLMAQEGLIEISNLLITFLNGIATISWETNKPTDAVLVFENGMGGTEGGYLDELFMTHHVVRIEGLDPNEDYYFKIFAKGIYGDDNFQTAQLYLLTPTEEVLVAEEDQEGQKEQEDIVGSGEVMPTSSSSQNSCLFTIKEVDDDSDHGAGIIPPEDISSREQEVVIGSSNLFVSIFNKVFKDSWLLQLLILTGIIIFTYLNFKK